MIICLTSITWQERRNVPLPGYIYCCRPDSDKWYAPPSSINHLYWGHKVIKKKKNCNPTAGRKRVSVMQRTLLMMSLIQSYRTRQSFLQSDWPGLYIIFSQCMQSIQKLQTIIDRRWKGQSAPPALWAVNCLCSTGFWSFLLFAPSRWSAQGSRLTCLPLGPTIVVTQILRWHQYPPSIYRDTNVYSTISQCDTKNTPTQNRQTWITR